MRTKLFYAILTLAVVVQGAKVFAEAQEFNEFASDSNVDEITGQFAPEGGPRVADEQSFAGGVINANSIESKSQVCKTHKRTAEMNLYAAAMARKSPRIKSLVIVIDKSDNMMNVFADGVILDDMINVPVGLAKTGELSLDVQDYPLEGFKKAYTVPFGAKNSSNGYLEMKNLVLFEGNRGMYAVNSKTVCKSIKKGSVSVGNILVNDKDMKALFDYVTGALKVTLRVLQ